MTIGEKIKKFRTAQKLSQKQLAAMAGMSEPALRNYELGNRHPSEEQVHKIADALGLSFFALSDPDFDSYHGVIHALFSLEDQYHLTPKEINGQIYLSLDDPSLKDTLRLWYDERNAFNDGQTSQEEYDLWRYSYPRLQAERDKEKRKLRYEEDKENG